MPMAWPPVTPLIFLDGTRTSHFSWLAVLCGPFKVVVDHGLRNILREMLNRLGQALAMATGRPARHDELDLLAGRLAKGKLQLCVFHLDY